VRGWLILICTFLVGAAVGVGLANRGPALIAPYLPKAVSGPGEHIEGQVIRKQRDGNRLLVKITTEQGPMLVTFTQEGGRLGRAAGRRRYGDAGYPRLCDVRRRPAS